MAKIIKKATKSTPFMVVAGMVIVAAVGLVIVPHLTKAGKPGAIWTTTNTCGDPQNVNHYNVGDVVYINGSGFDEDNYNWDITGLPSSADPNTAVASGQYSVGASGEFCFDAYTIQADDNGVYKATFDNKHDNYSVSGGEIPYIPYCGDYVVNQPSEECDFSDPQACNTIDGYLGTKFCLMGLAVVAPPTFNTAIEVIQVQQCVWSPCETEESCGDGIKNGNDADI